MSAVSVVLTGPQQREIRVLLQNSAGNLGADYGAESETIWDAYFSQYIDRLKFALNPYLNSLNDHMRNGEIDPPQPTVGLNGALRELTTSRLVDMITYSNVRILSELKNRFGVSAPTLEIVSNEYLNLLCNQHQISSPQVGLVYQPYILEVARLYTMNTAMSDRIHAIHPRSILEIDKDIINRFDNYHNLIIGLHHEMVRYLEIQTLRPYDSTCQNLNQELEQLRQSAYGPGTIPRIQLAVTNLSNAILSMIVINGIAGTPGTKVVLGLINRHWEIRRQMGLGFDSSVTVRAWYMTLLNRLEDELKRLGETVGNHPWIVKSRPILKRALQLVGNPNFHVE
jgi:hypothetical protein